MNLLRIALAVMIGAVQAQPQRSPASVEGVVLKLGTTEPLANANVQLNLEVSDDFRSESAVPDQVADLPPEQFHRKATSDGNGRFIFENVTPGEYRLIATYEGGYVPAEFGQRSPTGEGILFEIAPGQKMTGIQLAMAPTGSITGRIYDRNGEPIGKAQVLALRPVYKNGRRTLTIVQTVVSDDHGDYRLYWLAPGTYYVGTKPDVAEIPMSLLRGNSNSAPITHVTPPTRFGTYELGTTPVVHKRKLRTGEIVEEMYVPVYYPNTVDMAAATPVSLASGATVGGVNIPTGAGLITPRHIRGRVVDTAGQPVRNATVTAMPRTAAPYFAVSNAQSDENGSFDIGGVAPGSYQIFASSASEARTLNGIAAVEMAEKDVQIVPITMTTGFKLSGRFVLEAGARPGNGARASFPRIGNLIRDPEVVGTFPGLPEFNPSEINDGTFTVSNIASGNYRIALQQLPTDGYIKSMRMGSADVLNDGLRISSSPDGLLEIVIGANAGRIEGSVVNTRGEPLSNRSVVLVPDVRLRQRSDLYKVVSTDSAGRFRMQAITPGEYKLFAWENIETGAWQNPDFIQGYENAGRRIRIGEGTKEDVQLAVIP